MCDAFGLCARRLLLAAACVAAMLVAGCGRCGEPAPQTGAINPGNWPQLHRPLGHDPALEERLDALMAKMTLEDKVAQTIQASIDHITPDDVRHYRLGAVFGGGTASFSGKPTHAQWLALADAFWEASMDTADGGQAIPILWGIDAAHGQSQVVGATLFPHNIGLGATGNPELVRAIARATAIETRALGMEWIFAPTVAVPRDVRWGRSYESYSEHPALVAQLAAAFVEGLQGIPGSADFLGADKVLSAPKHFLGDGGTDGGKDQGNTRISEAQLRDIHAAGYISTLTKGAQSVMVGYNRFHGEALHGHSPLLTQVLKGRMDFAGFVTGGYNGHGRIPGCTPTDCVQGYIAGLDMLMAPDSWKGVYASTLEHARSGALPMARLEDAVRRILRVKLQMGLFDQPKPSQRALGGAFELLGNPEHRALAREAVRQSLVLLKNEAGLLPLHPAQRILLAGDGADNLRQQNGGWTLAPPGAPLTPEDFPAATSIWQGFQHQIEAAGGHAELALDGRWQVKPDVAVVVFGEAPYIGAQGDLADLRLGGGHTQYLELIQALKADGIPVVAVLLSGRPLWLNREINAADAFVAAWLPGAEGAGVADVLLRDKSGQVQHEIRGQLSFSWPATANPARDHTGELVEPPLFAFGHGLRYADDGTVPLLSEDSGLE